MFFSLSDVLNEKPTLMLGRMMKYIVNYGSDILNAVSKAIRDPVKVNGKYIMIRCGQIDGLTVRV